MTDTLTLMFADPPYPGMSKKHYRNHVDYAGEVDHVHLAAKLHEADGWVLCTASTTLHHVLDCLRDAGHDDYRIMSWVKPFAAFKRDVPVAYAWEPVIVRAARQASCEWSLGHARLASRINNDETWVDWRQTRTGVSLAL